MEERNIYVKVSCDKGGKWLPCFKFGVKPKRQTAEILIYSYTFL